MRTALPDIRPNWIVITGPPGSGKTSLRRHLEPMLGATSLDIIDSYSPNATFSLKEADEAFSKLLSAIDSSDQGVPLVIEAMFYQPERRTELLEVAAKKKSRVTFVLLDAPVECLFARTLNRPRRFKRAITMNRIAELRARFDGCEADLRFRTDEMSVQEIASIVEMHARERSAEKALPRRS